MRIDSTRFNLFRIRFTGWVHTLGFNYIEQKAKANSFEKYVFWWDQLLFRADSL